MFDNLGGDSMVEETAEEAKKEILAKMRNVSKNLEISISSFEEVEAKALRLRFGKKRNEFLDKLDEMTDQIKALKARMDEVISKLSGDIASRELFLHDPIKQLVEL